MTIQFRTRISPGIDYKDILNYGICCQGITLMDSYDYLSCYASGGYFIPGQITECPDPT